MVSSIRSRPICASQSLNGSALGEGIDWMMRSNCSVFATSVNRFFPSGAVIFNCTIFSYSSTEPSDFNFRLRSLQYLRGLSVPLNTSQTSTMEKYHSSFSGSHALRIRLSSKSWIWSFCAMFSSPFRFLYYSIFFCFSRSVTSICISYSTGLMEKLPLRYVGTIL